MHYKIKLYQLEKWHDYTNTAFKTSGYKIKFTASRPFLALKNIILVRNGVYRIFTIQVLRIKYFLFEQNI